MTQPAAYSPTPLRPLAHSAGTCTIEHGVAVPNTLLVNVAKYHFAHNYHHAIQLVQDLAGGLLVTAPAAEDLTAEATREYTRKYLGGRKGTDAEERLRLMYLIADMTASDYGVLQELLSLTRHNSFYTALI